MNGPFFGQSLVKIEQELSEKTNDDGRRRIGKLNNIKNGCAVTLLPNRLM